jgi:polysaccharide biosynthesis PFTS motif protein
MNKYSLAVEYLFHNSGWIYRPLWTYDAEKFGSKIIFYFYSTNCESFKVSDKDQAIPYGWMAMSWPCYLVWDVWQSDFIKRAIGDEAKIIIVGSIWFTSSPEVVPLKIKNSSYSRIRRKTSVSSATSDFNYKTNNNSRLTIFYTYLLNQIKNNNNAYYF